MVTKRAVVERANPDDQFAAIFEERRDLVCYLVKILDVLQGILADDVVVVAGLRLVRMSC